MKDYLNSINALRNKLQAGKTSLSESELLDLLSKTAQTITETISDHKHMSDNELIKELSELFSVILEGEYLSLFLSKIEESQFFLLGTALKNSYDESNSSLKTLLDEFTYKYLNFFRYSEFLKSVTDTVKWTELISELLNLSEFNTRKLFKQRVASLSK